MAADNELDAIRAFAAPNPASPSSAPSAAPADAADQADATEAADAAAEAAEAAQPAKPAARAPSGSGPADWFGGMVHWIASRPTPGGNLALLLVLVFFAWAIIPVNHGATRLQLLWLTLTGKADLVDQPDTSQGNDNGGSWWQPYLDPSATNGGSSSASGGGPGRILAPSMPYEHPSAVEWRPDDTLVSPRGPGL